MRVERIIDDVVGNILYELARIKQGADAAAWQIKDYSGEDLENIHAHVVAAHNKKDLTWVCAPCVDSETGGYSKFKLNENISLKHSFKKFVPDTECEFTIKDEFEEELFYVYKNMLFFPYPLQLIKNLEEVYRKSEIKERLIKPLITSSDFILYQPTDTNEEFIEIFDRMKQKRYFDIQDIENRIEGYSYQITELESEKHEIEEEIERFDDPLQELEVIKKDIQKFMPSPIETFYIKNNLLHLITEPLQITGYKNKPCRYSVSVGIFREKLVINNLDYEYRKNSNYPHPHIGGSGNLCLGNLRDIILDNRSIYKLKTLIPYILDFLRSYTNDKSNVPYISIEHWAPNLVDWFRCYRQGTSLSKCNDCDEENCPYRKLVFGGCFRSKLVYSLYQCMSCLFLNCPHKGNTFDIKEKYNPKIPFCVVNEFNLSQEDNCKICPIRCERHEVINE